MRLHALPFVFCLTATWFGLQVLNSASATVNAAQERRAEALCAVDASYCGNRR